MGFLFIAIGFVCDGAYALMSNQIGFWMKRKQKFQAIQNRIYGAIYIGLGLLTVFIESNNRK